MEHNENERLELRSEKMRRLVGNIPNSIYWASIITLVFSIAILAVMLLIFGKYV